MADNSIRISIELANSAANKALGDFTDGATKADASLKKLNETGKGAFDEIALHIGKASGAYEVFQGSLLANLAIKGIELLTDAAKELFNVFVTDGVKAAASYEQALQNLNVALASSGNYSESASQGFEEYASQIQKTTKYSDDAVLSNLAVLESLTQLDEKTLKIASNAAIDLAAARNIDLASAYDLVAKAANGNVTQLGRLGLAVEQGANNAETFSNALEKLSQFQGAAIGQVDTYAGATAQLGHAFEDLQKEVGFAITQNPVLITILKTLTSEFLDNAESANKNRDALKKIAGEGFLAIVDGAGIAITALDYIVRGFETLYNGARVSLDLLGGSIAEVFALFSDSGKKALADFNNDLVKASDNVKNAFTKDTGLQNIAQQLAVVSVNAHNAFDSMVSGASASKPAIENNNKAIRDTGEGLTAAEKAAQALYDTLVKQANTAKSQYDQQAKLIESNLKTETAATKAAVDAGTLSRRAALQKQIQDDQAAFNQRIGLLDEQHTTELDQLDSLGLEDADLNEAKMQADRNYYAQKQELADQYVQQAGETSKSLTQIKKAEADAAVGILSDLSVLMQSKNREQFEIGKAASIASTTISTYESAQKSYDALSGIPYVGPALGAAAAAAAIAAGLVRVSNISAQSPGFAEGGIVGGSSFTGDQVAARVNSGEMVLTQAQQARLFAISNGKGNGASSNQMAQLAASVQALAAQPVQVVVDGSVVFSAVRTQLKNGRTLA